MSSCFSDLQIAGCGYRIAGEYFEPPALGATKCSVSLPNRANARNSKAFTIGITYADNADRKRLVQMA